MTDPIPAPDLSDRGYYTTLLQPAYDELAAIQRWRTRRNRARSEAAAWEPGMAAALVGLIRGNPHMEHAIAVGLAGAGFTAEDPISQFAAYEAAVQQQERFGGDWPNGVPIPRNRLSQGTSQDRFNAEVQAGFVMGLFDENGLLLEPTERNQDDPGYRQFTRMREAAQAAGVDLPFVSHDGRPAVIRARSNEAPSEEQRANWETAIQQRVEGRLGRRELPGSPVERGAIEQRIEGEERAQELRTIEARRSGYRVEYLDEPESIGGGGTMPGLGQAAGAQAAEALGLGEVRGDLLTAGVTPDATYNALQDMSRQAFMILDAPVQEIQGQFRNLIGAMRGRSVDWGEAQSDFLINVGRATRGQPHLEAGTGFFVDPRSPLAEERLRRERERGLINGQVITIGRWGASQIVEPGTTPYRLLSGAVDAGVQLADPSALALKGAGRLRRAATLFQPDEALEAAGGLRGIRRVVHGPSAGAWLNGPQGRRVVEALAAEPNAGRIWRTLNRRVEPNLAARIADTSDPGEVAGLLHDQLGTTIRRTTELPFGLGERIVRRADPVEVRRMATPAARRFTDQMPGYRIDSYDPQDAMVQTERWLQNAKVEEDVADALLDRLARQETRAGIFDVVTDAMVATDGVLARHGVNDPSVRSRLTRMFRDTHRDARHYFMDEVGADVPVWSSVMVNGDDVPAFGPHLGAELLDRYIPLPDARAVRRMTSKFKRVFANAEGELRLPLAFVESVQNEIWKPMQLLRAAWPLRVIGEEQLRMAAAGRDSMFHHPMSYISWVVGRKGGTDLAGNPLTEAEEFRRAMSKGSQGWLTREPGKVRTAVPTVYHRDRHELPEFLDAWAGELAMLHADPVAKQVALTDNLNEVTRWFTTGPGQKFRRELAEAHPEVALDNPLVARNYLESVSERIRIKTGGDPELVDIVRTGKLRGRNVFESDGLRHRDLSVELEGFMDSAPGAVKGSHIASFDPSQGERVLQSWRRGVDTAFSFLMGKRTNQLSRSPVFRQAYWQEVERLVPFADEATKSALVAQGREAGTLASRKARKLEHMQARGDLSLEEVDALAKGHALDETKALLYDLSERSQFFDAMRVVFPFGEAWREMVTRWGQLLTQNPQSIRRAQQVIEGARGEDFGQVMGAPDGKGFFHKSEFDGSEVFVYPFSQAVTRATVGVPIPLVGKVQGLNLMGTVAPGLGPVAQIPVAALIPDKPGLAREIRQLALPFGSPVDEGDTASVTNLLTYAPAWLKRAYQAVSGGGFDAESSRIYSNSVMDVATYLYSTGKYDTSTREGMAELLEDAKRHARRFYTIRSLAQFVAPSAPSPEWLVQSNGELVDTTVLAEEYYSLLAERPETAAEDFLELYGDEVALVMQAKTRTTVAGLEGGGTATQELEDWANAHPDVVRDLPNTWAFFAPRGDPGDFDYASYVAQIRRGEREPLTPDEWLRLSNDRLGTMIYRKGQRMAGPNPNEEVRAWLRQVKERIRENYPGYDEGRGIPEGTDPAVIVDELEAAAEMPAIRDTEAGEGLRIYMRGRRMAQEEAERRGLASFRDAQSARDLRDWLRQVAGRISANRPAFDGLWWRVFERELADDTREVAAA